MSKFDDYTTVLTAAYNEFILNLGGKKVPTPYKRNQFGSYQKLGPEFQGKSSPEVITEATIKLAGKLSFKLESASIEEIRQFMIDNQLGIDCSGFAYRMINSLTKKILHKPLTGLGFEHVGRTNIAKLTLPEHSIKLSDFSQAQPGDIIRLNSDDIILHGLIVLQNIDNVITYAHASGETRINGVHQGEITDGQFPPELNVFTKFNPDNGDGYYRLKILQ